MITEWICRGLITLDLYLVASGYISFFQTKHQLLTPLIPHSILYDVADNYMKASLITIPGLIVGLWFYFFRKRIVAIVFLCIAALSYQTMLLLINK